LKDSGWNEFHDLRGPLAEWLQSVSLTEEESESIRTGVLEQRSEREDTRLSRQLTRINRIVAFSNRSTVPYSERYRIYTVVNP
jgi:hypothetical protein